MISENMKNSIFFFCLLIIFEVVLILLSGFNNLLCHIKDIFVLLASKHLTLDFKVGFRVFSKKIVHNCLPLSVKITSVLIFNAREVFE